MQCWNGNGVQEEDDLGNPLWCKNEMKKKKVPLEALCIVVHAELEQLKTHQKVYLYILDHSQQSNTLLQCTFFWQKKAINYFSLLSLSLSFLSLLSSHSALSSLASSLPWSLPSSLLSLSLCHTHRNKSPFPISCVRAILYLEESLKFFKTGIAFETPKGLRIICCKPSVDPQIFLLCTI